MKGPEYPTWIEYDEDAYKKYKNIDKMSDEEVESFFKIVYTFGSKYQEWSDYYDGVSIKVCEYEPPKFTNILSVTIK